MDIIGTTITFLVIGIDGILHGDLTILDMEMVMVMVMVMVMEGIMWNNWWHPYYNGPDYNDPYYYRNDNRVAYMNGKRSSLYSTDKGILENSSNSNTITNYNVGRNDSKIVNSKTGEKTENLEQIKNRNINRVYYAP